LNAQCDDANPVCPEQVYEIVFAEVNRNDSGKSLFQVMWNESFEVVSLDKAMGKNRNLAIKKGGFTLLSNVETYFFMQDLSNGVVP
jgi:hypothetical protein